MKLARRTLLLALAQAGLQTEATAFGEGGAFHARLLSFPSGKWQQELSAARRWSLELTRRTSAPGRLATRLVRPTSDELLQEPFAVWAGAKDPGALPPRVVRALRQYLRMGGILLIDDRLPGKGEFSASARREMARVLPESAVVPLGQEHVLFKTFYILEQPQGRVDGPVKMDAIVRGKTAQVLFLKHDLLGALATNDGEWARPMEAKQPHARELALRFAVNIAMYVLCSDYKDDQVHAPHLMRRRHQRR